MQSREWRVVTQCGRNISQEAESMNELFDKVIKRGYTPIFVQPLEEYDPQFRREAKI